MVRESRSRHPNYPVEHPSSARHLSLSARFDVSADCLCLYLNVADKRRVFGSVQRRSTAPTVWNRGYELKAAPLQRRRTFPWLTTTPRTDVVRETTHLLVCPARSAARQRVFMCRTSSRHSRHTFEPPPLRLLATHHRMTTTTTGAIAAPTHRGIEPTRVTGLHPTDRGTATPWSCEATTRTS